jgi:hypothetical protein
VRQNLAEVLKKTAKNAEKGRNRVKKGASQDDGAGESFTVPRSRR